MRVEWDNWIAQYYRRFNARLFGRCVAVIQDDRRLALEEFRYIVLGCGYYFEVCWTSADAVVARVKRQINGPYGGDIAGFVLDEARIRRRVEEHGGWEVGPDGVRLSSRPKRGPVPDPAPTIAALTVDTWIKSRIAKADPDEFVCALYQALSGRPINSTTLNRRRKTAEAVKARRYDETPPMIEAWLGMLESRYKGFRRREDDDKQAGRASVTKLLEKEGIPELYPINGWATGVLRAVGVTVEPRKPAGGGVLTPGQKPSRVVM